MTTWPDVSTVLPVLIESSLRSIIFAALIGCLLMVLRTRSTSGRLLAWTLVLYGALLMPGLGSLIPSIRLGFLPSAIPEQVLAMTPEGMRAVPPPQMAQPLVAVTALETETRSTSNPKLISWWVLLTGVYLAGCLVLLGKLVAGAALTRRMLRTCRPIRDSHLGPLVRECGVYVPLGGKLEVLESHFVLVPVTVGWLKSRIILPADWRQWDDEKLRFVVDHELSHVRRGDYIHRVLSLIHRAVFWFNPLSWWLHTHLAELAEQASDEAALIESRDATRYVEIVLGFLEVLEHQRRRVHLTGIAMARTSRMGRRLARILALNSPRPANLSRRAAVALTAVSLVMLVGTAAVSPALSQAGIEGGESNRVAASPLFSSEYLQTVQAASHLPLSNATQLEARLRDDPEDSDARARLLVLYTNHRNENPSLGRNWADHVLWLIENRPDAEILGSYFAVPQSSGNHLTGEQYSRAAAAWERTILSGQPTARAAWNGSQFYRLQDPRLYESYLRLATELAPSNEAWGTELGLLYAESIVAARRAGAGSPAPAPKVEWAADAQRYLDTSSNTAVLAGAARTFHSESNKTLVIRGHPDSEYYQLAQHLFRKALDLGAALDQSWVLPELPTKLAGALSLQGQSVRAPDPLQIRKAQPSEFSALPARLQEKLDSDGCLIPQPPSMDGEPAAPRNVISGEFQRPGQSDWAIVCEYPDRMQAIVVFWAGSDTQMSVASRSPASESGCWTEINPVGGSFIMQNYRAFGGPKPPPIEHQGIDAGICAKASVTHYFYQNQWLALQGGD